MDFFISILLGLIIPVLFILAPTIFQIVYTVRRIRNKTQMSLLVIFLVAIFMGSILPFAATFISMYGLGFGASPDEKRCLTGIESFVFLGIGIAITITPLIGLAGAIIQYFKARHPNRSILTSNRDHGGS